MLRYSISLSSGDGNNTPSIENISINFSGTAGITESEARLAIEQAINGSLTNRTIYADKQVYGRNLSNSQVLGTFDRFVSYGSKRWAINYLTGSDAYTNLFNLTPTLFVYETTDKTTAQLRTDVETFINATK